MKFSGCIESSALIFFAEKMGEAFAVHIWAWLFKLSLALQFFNQELIKASGAQNGSFLCIICLKI